MIRDLPAIVVAGAGLASALFAIAACEKRPTQVDQTAIPGEVYDFQLEDGTRCVAWVYQGRSGSIACEFKEKNR